MHYKVLMLLKDVTDVTNIGEITNRAEEAMDKYMYYYDGMEDKYPDLIEKEYEVDFLEVSKLRKKMHWFKKPSSLNLPNHMKSYAYIDMDDNPEDVNTDYYDFVVSNKNDLKPEWITKENKVSWYNESMQIICPESYGYEYLGEIEILTLFNNNPMDFAITMDMGYLNYDEKEDSFYTLRNMNASFDWYVIGGRFKNGLQLRNFTEATFAKAKDIQLGFSSIHFRDLKKAMNGDQNIIEEYGESQIKAIREIMDKGSSENEALVETVASFGFWTFVTSDDDTWLDSDDVSISHVYEYLAQYPESVVVVIDAHN